VLILRTVTAEDWPLWRDARLAALADAPHAFKSGLADWHRGGEMRWRARLETPGTYNLVALLDERLVGMARGVPGENGTCELRSVWVGPEGRGRGIGDLLLDAVESWARRSGALAIRLAVLPGNDRAVALYRRHGFVPADEPGDLLADGRTREQIMLKSPSPDSHLPAKVRWVGEGQAGVRGDWV
jgi:ribosomal protein S18 acetylase RimI-like enzyme